MGSYRGPPERPFIGPGGLLAAGSQKCDGLVDHRPTLRGPVRPEARDRGSTLLLCFGRPVLCVPWVGL